MVTTNQIIEEGNRDPTSIARIRYRICKLSKDLIMLEEILAYILEALEIIEIPPEPPEQAGRSLYERLEISSMRNQLIRRAMDLKKVCLNRFTIIYMQCILIFTHLIIMHMYNTHIHNCYISIPLSYTVLYSFTPYTHPYLFIHMCISSTLYHRTSPVYTAYSITYEKCPLEYQRPNYSL